MNKRYLLSIQPKDISKVTIVAVDQRKSSVIFECTCSEELSGKIKAMFAKRFLSLVIYTDIEEELTCN